MVVTLTLEPPTELVWYLAYGSNLASSKFTRDRGIKPLAAVTIVAPGYTLAMEGAGLPYQEPSYATIRPLSRQRSNGEVELLGTAYLITPAQYAQVIRSEGGGIAYKEASIRVIPVQTKDKEELEEIHWRKESDIEEARTLIGLLTRTPAPTPSKRYMKLIIDGACESNYPLEYRQYLSRIPTYRPPTHPWAKLGAFLFLSLWAPIMSFMEKLTKWSIKRAGDEDGNAPYVIVLLVRAVVRALWWHHDYIHAPLWGRGDGIKQFAEQLLLPNSESK
ncbi:hypothetical protein F5Y16DRAFT_416274 [Xylariaceae sp. FL0255]|nr:hypothetical protein F5Y16DRAFT_416274 [Xylariaceae sp. FL0255]